MDRRQSERGKGRGGREREGGETDQPPLQWHTLHGLCLSIVKRLGRGREGERVGRGRGEKGEGKGGGRGEEEGQSRVTSDEKETRVRFDASRFIKLVEE